MAAQEPIASLVDSRDPVVRITRLSLSTPDAISWADFRERYRHYLAVAMRTKSRIDAESRLDLAERIIRPQLLVDLASQAALDELQAALLQGSQSRFNRPRSTATVRSHMRSVIAALNWARSKQLLSHVGKVQLLTLEERDVMKGRPLVPEEVDRMLDATRKVVGKRGAPYWRFLLKSILASGLRLSELMRLSWDIPQTIRPIYRPGALPVLSFPAALQKNKRFQEIPLCPWLEELISRVPESMRHGWIFKPPSIEACKGRLPRSERLTDERVGKIITAIGKAAGVVVDEGNARTGSPPKYASAHDLRRTFAVRLRNANLPPDLIRKLMRHADIKTTERYYLVEDTQHDANRLRQLLSHN